jgi:hypothetical protein
MYFVTILFGNYVIGSLTTLLIVGLLLLLYIHFVSNILFVITTICFCCSYRGWLQCFRTVFIALFSFINIWFYIFVMFAIFHFRRSIDCLFVDQFFVLTFMIFSISFDVLLAVDCYFFVHIYCFSHMVVICIYAILLFRSSNFGFLSYYYLGCNGW